MLDIGCGNGQRLLELERYGCSELFGMEPTVGSAEQARRAMRADIRTAYLDEAGLPDGHYSLEILNQVLEHVPSPKSTLQSINRLLRPGGSLYLTVPNYGSAKPGFSALPGPGFKFRGTSITSRRPPSGPSSSRRGSGSPCAGPIR